MEEKIIALYEQGYSQKQICEMLDLQFYSVNKCLTRHGIKTGHTKRTPDEIRNLIIFLVKQGKQQSDIAEMLDVSIHNVRDITYENGLSGVTCKKRRELNHQIIKDKYSHGKTIDIISEEMHADKKRVKSVLVKAGLYKSNKTSDAEILHRLRTGETIASISKTCGASYRRIKRLLDSETEGGPT